MSMFDEVCIDMNTVIMPNVARDELRDKALAAKRLVDDAIARGVPVTRCVAMRPAEADIRNERERRAAASLRKGGVKGAFRSRMRPKERI